MSIENRAKAGKEATYAVAHATTEQKNQVLQKIISLLQEKKQTILGENQKDIEEAKATGLSESMIDRLSLQGGRLEGICDDIRQVIGLPDPVGDSFEEETLGPLQIKKQRIPIGLLGIIYESRPNVTIDCSALAIKSGNCALLRGGSETLRTNTILVQLIQEALETVGLPKEAIQLVPSRDRAEVEKMLHLHEMIDLIIPRGGASLHRFCRENSTIPVITGGIGVCHLFVDASAQLEKSLEVIYNAKIQRPTVCNALDTLLVHEKVAEVFIPQVLSRLSAQGVTFRLDSKSEELAQKYKASPCYSAAQAEDWDTEWLRLVLGIKIVKDLQEAIAHIIQHSTGHSDGILTEDKSSAECFVKAIDSAVVYVNASTRFTDGGQLGLGGEVAISTQKLHARGPMGLRELTSYKWVVSGDYTTRK